MIQTTGFTNGTNQGRVDKIVEMVGLLQKSAASNKASSAEAWELMQPAIDAIGELVGAAPEPVEASQAPEAPKIKTQASVDVQRLDMQLAEMARTVPLKDLVRTMAVFLNRIDEELSP